VVRAESDAVELAVWEALASVHDPEIPPLAITDLGIVEEVRVGEDRVDVKLLPTFVGCPALDVIRADCEAAVREMMGEREVNVRFVFDPAWTSDRITPAGREALRSHGLTPPGSKPVVIPLASFGREAEGPGTRCPFCGSEDTVLESSFGPTLCRSTHFCRSCRNPFEAFKPKVPRSA